jgi:MFS family permease
MVRAGADKTFSSLSIPNYRRFVTAQLISMTGTWMQTVALGWLVLRLTGSGSAVGFNLALQFLPILVLGMWGGVVADRFNKRRVLMYSQAALGVVSLVLFGVTTAEVGSVGLIYALTFCIGLITVIDNPSRQSFVSEMVGREHVANAVSLNSAVFNASRIVGPAVAGVLISQVGLPWAFGINSLTFIAPIVALWLMDPTQLTPATPSVRDKGQVREGLRYVWSTVRLRNTVLLVGLISIFGLNFSVVLPLFARFVFGRGAETFGFLTSMMAGGALVGALVSAARGRPTRRFFYGSAIAFGTFVILAALAPSVPVMGLLLVATGAASISFIASANATLQLTAAPEMRGRVMALHGLVFLGSTPIGAPLIGRISEVWGPRVGLLVGGSVSLLAALGMVIFVRRDRIEDKVRNLVYLRRRHVVLPEGTPEGMPDAPPASERKTG